MYNLWRRQHILCVNRIRTSGLSIDENQRVYLSIQKPKSTPTYIILYTSAKVKVKELSHIVVFYIQIMCCILFDYGTVPIYRYVIIKKQLFVSCDRVHPI